MDGREAAVHPLHVIIPRYVLAEFKHALFEFFFIPVLLKAAKSAQAVHQHTGEGQDHEQGQQYHYHAAARMSEARMLKYLADPRRLQGLL